MTIVVGMCWPCSSVCLAHVGTHRRMDQSHWSAVDAWKRMKPPMEAILPNMNRSANEEADDGACFSIQSSEA